MQSLTAPCPNIERAENMEDVASSDILNPPGPPTVSDVKHLEENTETASQRTGKNRAALQVPMNRSTQLAGEPLPTDRYPHARLLHLP